MTNRGKTTPASTGGSYSPATGARSRVELDTHEDAPPAKTAAVILIEQASAAMEKARAQLWVALEKDVADTVRAKWPTAARVGLIQNDSDVTDLSEAVVYANGTDDDPDGAVLATIDYDMGDPMYRHLDDTFRSLRDSGWEAEEDRYSGEHFVDLADADAAFEPHRPAVPKPGSNLTRSVYQIEVLHNTDDPLSHEPDVGTVAYWISEGHASGGGLDCVSSVEVGEDDMARLLTAQGSDPSFLLDDDDTADYEDDDGED